MAQEVVGFKLVLDGKEQVVNSIGEMKKLLKEANFELLKAQQNFGEYSAEAVNAAKKVATLKDTIQEAGETAQLFDPGKKFQAFAGAITAVAGGFTAVQGALGLVGVESKDVEKSLLRVQSALALSQGLSTLADSAKDFQRLAAIIKETSIVQGLYNFVIKGTVGGLTLQNVVTKATALTTNIFKTAINGVKTASITTAGALRVLRGVIAGLGIGALIFGVTALIDKIISWTSSTDKAAEAQKKLAAQTDLINAKLNNEIAILTAIGGKEDEVYRKKVEIAKNELALLRKKFDDQKKFTIEEAKQFGELKTQLVVLEQEEKNRIAKIREDAAKKQKEKDKEAADKAKATAKQLADEREQDQKDAINKLRDLENENFANTIKDETQRALVLLSQKKEQDILDIQQSKANAETKAKVIAEIERQFVIQKEQIETDASIKRKEKETADAKEASEKLTERINLENQIRITGIQNEFERKKAELDFQKLEEETALAKKREEGLIGEEAYQQGLLNIKNKYVEAETELKKKQADDEAKIREARRTAELELYDTIGQGLGALGNLFGQGTAANKAFALSELAINTATGFVRGMSIAQQGAAATGPAAPFAYPIFYAQQIVSVLNAVNKARGILKTVKGGAGSSPSISAPSISGGSSAPITPATPEATLTQVNQSINRLGSATNRAYVVESDITNSQERIRRINRAARLN
jgi:hypothetical protein